MNRPVGAALLLALSVTFISVRASALDPARVGWSAIEISGSKFFISAASSVALHVRPREAIAAVLLTPPQGVPVAPGASVIEMHYAATLAGQRTAMTLLLDPPTAAALQLVLRDSGRRERQRSWRFTDRGGYQWTRRPASAAESSRLPAAWTDTSEGMRVYPQPTAGAPVTDAAALIYVLAAAPLAAKGDRYEILEFSRRRLHRVTAEVSGVTTVAADYRESRSGPVGTADGNAAGATQVATDPSEDAARETRRIKGPVAALRIRLRGESLGEAAEDEEDKFALLGLTDGIEVLLEPSTRLPMQISGRAPYLGRATLRLKSATLR